jgi:hypothetical protein
MESSCPFDVKDGEVSTIMCNSTSASIDGNTLTLRRDYNSATTQDDVDYSISFSESMITSGKADLAASKSYPNGEECDSGCNIYSATVSF